MKKLIPMIVIILSFLAFPATGQDSYRIRLKNGGEFTTVRYWSEGDQIKFYTSGGIAGVQKDSIKKIEKTASENILYRKSDSDQKSPEISSKTNGHGDEKTEEEVVVDLSYYTKKKGQLDAELDRALDRLREATKNRDTEAKNKARETLKKIHNEIYVLTEEVRGMNKGKIPEGWWKKK